MIRYGVLLALLLPAVARAETVMVKYRGAVDLTPFACETVSDSRVVGRVCYDRSRQFMVAKITGTYYAWCGVPASLVSEWRAAASRGRFFNERIKGQFDC